MIKIPLDSINFCIEMNDTRNPYMPKEIVFERYSRTAFELNALPIFPQVQVIE